MPSISDFQSTYIFDPHLAEVHSNLTGGRIVVLSSEAIRSLQENLYKKFSTGASVIILEMGVSYGTRIFDEIYKQSKLTPESEPVTLHSIAQILFKSGFGKIAFSEDPEPGRKLNVVINNCAFCVNSHPENNCNFLRGVILAMTGRMFSRQYKSSVLCSGGAAGHVCKIELILSKGN